MFNFNFFFLVGFNKYIFLNKIIYDYRAVFSEELGTPKNFQADMPIDLQVIPKNLVLYSLKEKIEHELEQ